MYVFQRLHKFSLTLLSLGLLPLSLLEPVQASPCPTAALSQVLSHQAAAGDTLSSVAQQYGLLPGTLMAMNPTLPSQGDVPTGQIIQVPPFNGLPVQVAAGDTWQSLAERHGMRSDLLFEVNGCPSALLDRVFIPGGNPSETTIASTALGYPLPAPATLVLSYGWQPHPQRDELVFNSGIAFSAEPGTEVTSAANGTVAFVGDYNGALMVVVNHRSGLQTRYGNLENVGVGVGDAVTQGSPLGNVTGNVATSFMYFEVRTNSNEGWIARDPGLYLAELELQR